VPVNTDFEAYKSKPRLKQNEAAQSKRRVWCWHRRPRRRFLWSVTVDPTTSMTVNERW
jgi:hypothetical protein